MISFLNINYFIQKKILLGLIKYKFKEILKNKKILFHYFLFNINIFI